MDSQVERFRKNLPALRQGRIGPIYFDNACTTLRPQSVIDSMTAYYSEHPGCHRRAVHDFGQATTRKYAQARQAVQRLVNAAKTEEIVFNRNTTEGINLVASGLGLRSGDGVLTSDFEHNSNLLPWQNLARTRGIRHRLFEILPGASADQAFESYLKALRSERIKLVSVFHTSHVTGLRLPIREMASAAHEAGALFLCDAAQALLHCELDVRALGVDLMAFSFHKALGPSGVGALYGKLELLENLTPLLLGGETVDDADYGQCTLAPVPERFEAGLQDYAGVIGAGAAVECLLELRKTSLREKEGEVFRFLRDGISKLGRARIVGAEGSIVCFHAEGLGSGDFSRILNDTRRIMVRSGVLCAHAWYRKNRLPTTVRISLAPYNTMEEARTALQVIEHVSRYY